MSNENYYNILYFENNNIDPKQFFAEKRRLEENSQANRNKKKDINNIKKYFIFCDYISQKFYKNINQFPLFFQIIYILISLLF